MTKEQFLNTKIENISSVYLGKDHHCRCGCGGKYVSTSYMLNPRSEVNDKSVEKQLTRAKKLINSEAEYQINDICINIVVGKNRALTFYFHELA